MHAPLKEKLSCMGKELEFGTLGTLSYLGKVVKEMTKIFFFFRLVFTKTRAFRFCTPLPWITKTVNSAIKP